MRVARIGLTMVAAWAAMLGAWMLRAPAGDAATPPTPDAHVPAWLWCGVDPDDPTAATAVATFARSAGIDATFGPCSAPANYTPANPGTRYVPPAQYLKLLQLNATVGMKTVVFDERLWSPTPSVRAAALAFWMPHLANIAAWDLGDEFNPNVPDEWNALRDRWTKVLAGATAATGIRPYANHLWFAVGVALEELPGSDQLMSFDRYDRDKGLSVVKEVAPAVTDLMCAVNAFTHGNYKPNAASIRDDAQLLLRAGCDSILVFGGQKVIGSSNFGPFSIADALGRPTDWAAGVLEGTRVPDPGLTPLVPARLLDTRVGEATVDGQAQGLGLRAAESTTELQVGGRAAVPVDAAAVVLNVTVADPSAAGFVTVFPCGTALPLAASANYVRGTTVSNAVIAQLGAGGKVCLYTKAAVHLVVDITGYHPKGSRYTPAGPARLLDTRPGEVTVDGQAQGTGLAAAESTTEVTVGGRAGVPADAAAVVLNVTATGSSGAGFVTVFPCGLDLPLAATLNYDAGVTVSNAVVVPVGAGGKVCLYTKAAAHLVADVTGYQPPGSRYAPAGPARLLDTRPGERTVDGVAQGIGIRAGDAVLELPVAGRAEVPADAAAVVLNVTVTQPAASGFAVVWPCGSAVPLAANANYARGATVSNAVIARVGTGGKVCVLTKADAHLVIDIAGYVPGT